MAYKMAATYQFAVVDLSHLTSNGFQIPYIDYFYQTLAQVRIWALTNNQKMVTEMAAKCQFALVDTLT